MTSSPESSGSADSGSSDNKEGGLSTGAIIGLSVAGGVVVLGAGLFLVYRLTSQRFSGFDDDGDDAIRW